MTTEIWDEILKYGAYSQEFDWFALDKKGYLGAFTAVMNAPIPVKIKSSLKDYIQITHFIDALPKITVSLLSTSENGNFSSWVSYAEKGLFAFDFQDIHRKDPKNQYDLIARPLVPLNLRTMNIPSSFLDNMTTLDCEFEKGDLKTENLL